ncbi:MAG TPA: hypothetical protein VKY57_10165 [Chitinispirillaceae bacterium]|nr:hypothetical protein [Fibrobacter sp.]HLV31922.1 hypothetical protein [Chitinispirillaceae bacterium]
MMKLHSIICFLSLAIYLLTSCSSDIAGTGSGTQTTNGICISSNKSNLTGYICSIDSEQNLKQISPDTFPVSLQIFSSDYKPYNKTGFSRILYTDNTGYFSCDTLLSGIFNILAYDQYENSGIFFKNIPLGDTLNNYTVHKLFTPCKTIKGVINDSSNINANAIAAYIIGTPFFELADSTGLFFLHKIPVAQYTIQADYFALSQGRSLDIIVRPGSVGDTISVSDTIATYTDKIKIQIDSDSMMHHVELTL